MSRLTVAQAEQLGLISSTQAATLKPGTTGRGLPGKVAGTMNGMERRYAAKLDAGKVAGLVLWWCYEPCRLKIGHDTYYVPDFWVMMADGTLEFHETKGYMTPNGRTKIRVAARLFPVRFVLVKEAKGQFSAEAVGE